MDDAVLVPVGALFRRGAGWAVFVVGDGIARERAISLSRRGPRLAAVPEGLAPGDVVVLFPPSSLRNGSRVQTLR